MRGARQGLEEGLWRDFFKNCSCGDYHGHDSSLGNTVEYDTILAKIRALVSNKKSHGRLPTLDVDKVSVGYAKVQTESSDGDQEIHVVNMSIQCHGCGGWKHYKSKCPTAWAVMQEQRRAGSKVPGKKARAQSAKGIGGFGKGGKGKGVFLAGVFNGCEPGTPQAGLHQCWRH